MPISQFAWGDGYENVVTMEIPLQRFVTDRPPRSGSRVVQLGSGVEDAFITGRDYRADVRVASVPQLFDLGTDTPVSGSRSWQEFLDWARLKNAFRFIPDETYPGFYLPDCYLVEPMEGFGSLAPDGNRREFDLVIRNATYDFGPALRGIMLEYRPGGLQDLLTVTRATAANQIVKDQTLASVASGVLRDRHWIGGVRTALLEAARTQLATNPDTPASWSDVGTPVVTTGQTDPWGGSAAVQIEDDDGAGREGRSTGITFASDGIQIVEVAIRAGTAGVLGIDVDDTAAPATRATVKVTWQGGTTPPVVEDSGLGDGAQQYFSSLSVYDDAGNLWWIVRFSVANIVSANAHTVTVVVGTTGAATGTFFLAGANAFDSTYPSSWQGGSLGTRNADQVTSVFPWKPQAMHGYVRFIEQAEPNWVNVGGVAPRILNVGGAGTDALDIYKLAGGDSYAITHAGASGTVTSTIDLNSSHGDEIELFPQVFSDGSVKLSGRKNGGSIVAGTQSAALAFARAWSAQTLQDGGIGANGGGDIGLIERKVLVGPGTTLDAAAAA